MCHLLSTCNKPCDHVADNVWLHALSLVVQQQGCSLLADFRVAYEVYCDICGLQNYKETCQNIIYDCTTDIISAVCGNNKPNVPTAEQYNSSTLPGASSCPGNIANAWGILQCQGVSDNSPSSSSADPTCGNTYLYVSQLDNSGGDAPDGVSQTCTSSSNCDELAPIPVAGISCSIVLLHRHALYS